VAFAANSVPALTPEASRAKRLSIICLLLMVLGSIGLDQVSKTHAQKSLMIWSDPHDPAGYQGQRFPIWSSNADVEFRGGDSSFISISTNYVRNLGAAWGALASLPDYIRVPFFYLVTSLAVVIILIYMRSTPVHHRLVIFSLALIMSGAVGNFIDRVRFGYVIDWIDVRWNILGWHYDFPNFNVADSSISVGVMLLLVDMVFFERSRAARTELLKPTKAT